MRVGQEKLSKKDREMRHKKFVAFCKRHRERTEPYILKGMNVPCIWSEADRDWIWLNRTLRRASRKNKVISKAVQINKSLDEAIAEVKKHELSWLGVKWAWVKLICLIQVERVLRFVANLMHKYARRDQNGRN